MIDQLKEAFNDFWLAMIGAMPRMVAAVLFLLIFFFLGYFVHKVFQKGMKNRWRDPIVVGFTGNALKWLFYLIGFLAALHALGLGGLANSLIAGAGISAIIVGFAFKDIAENFLAGLLLAINRPFHTGNIIAVNNFKGTVRGMDLRTTHIRNVDGMDIYIPNAMIVKNVVINYTKDGLLRQAFTVGLDVNADVEEARRLIIDFLKNQEMVLDLPAPDVLTEEIGPSTINLLVLFWVDVLQDKSVPPAYLGATLKGQVISRVKDLLLQNGFNLPCPIIEHKMYDRREPFSVRVLS